MFKFEKHYSMKKLTTFLIFLFLFVGSVAYGQFDTIKAYSNQNVITLQDTLTKQFHFVFSIQGLTEEQFKQMRTELELRIITGRIWK